MKSIFLILFILVLIIPTNLTYSEILHEELGLVSDFLISENLGFYFFELDESISSSTWISDTRIVHGDENSINYVSDDLFLYSTELHEMNDYLIFAVLSEECIGGVVCDFQDIIKMSKTDGSYEKIVFQMKSAIHLAVTDNNFYLSESNGKIWKFSKDGDNGQLLYEGDNFIMDITVLNDEIYWIEEISDGNSLVLMLKDNQVIEIATNLQIAYDLSHNDKNIFWNEIRIGAREGKAVEYTKFTIYDGQNVKTISEYNNKNPLSSLTKSVYGPYGFLDHFLFLANNTSDKSTIHLIDYNTNQNFELETIYDYDIRYFRNNPNSLYVIGQTPDGFLIDKLSLPVSVPEFSIFLLLTLVMGFSLIVVSPRFFHY